MYELKLQVQLIFLKPYLSHIYMCCDENYVKVDTSCQETAKTAVFYDI